MVDLSVNLCGVNLANPLVLASGPLSWNAAAIHEAFSAGAAAVVTKTIRPVASPNPVPHIAALRGGAMLNTEGWSDLSGQQWVTEEMPALAERSGVLIASLGHTPEEVSELAGPLAQSGADMLEVVSYKASDLAPMVAAARHAASIPVLAKVSASWSDLTETLEACVGAGADGLTAIDSIGPALRIDLESGRPVLGSFAWLSGSDIRPIALRAVAQICLEHNVPVVGTGGVSRADDVLEMMMAGATAVGVHTAPLLHGLGWFGKTLDRLQKWLDDRHHADLSPLQGRVLPHLQEPTSSVALRFSFHADACTRCGRCVTVCAYRARSLTEGPLTRVNSTLCRSCGLCASVCPTQALSLQS